MMPFETPSQLSEAQVAAGLHLIASALNRKVGNDTILVFHRVLDRDGVTPDQFEAAVRDYLHDEETFPSPSKLLRYAKGGPGGGRIDDAYIHGTTIRASDYVRDPDRYAAVLCQRENDLREAAAKERALRAALALTSTEEKNAERIAEQGAADRTHREPGQGLHHEEPEASGFVLVGSQLGPPPEDGGVDAADGLDQVQPVLPEPDRKGCPF
jgi:hypothetical protein